MKNRFLILTIFSFILSLQNNFLFAQVGGYVDKFSVSNGENITFYISTTSDDSSNLSVSFFQITENVLWKKTLTGIKAGFQPTPDSSFYYGCNWNPTFTFQIPSDWDPGVYRAEFHREGNSSSGYQSYGVLFIVKPTVLASHSNILLLVASNTYQAYNTYGGQSLYEQFPETGGMIPRSNRVSMQRPAALPLGFLGSADFYKYEQRFINWAFNNKINLEYASKYDLDIHNDFLVSGGINRYKVVFIVGHNEYWSKPERDQCENYLANGGKIIILSGNTCWWQVRFEDDGKTMVCYKDTTDPIYNTDKSLVTTNWWKSPVNNSENSFTGVNFKFGGYVNSGTKLPHSQGYGDFAAFNTFNWIYEGTDLQDGDEFGYDDAIVGYETDGTRFYYDIKGSPIPYLTNNDETPANYRILAVSPAVAFDPVYISNYNSNNQGNEIYPHATMGFYYTGNNGAVFNGATTDWSDGLFTNDSSGNYPDPVVDRITKNVLNKFLENRFPPEITDWSPSLRYFKYINADPEYYNVRDTMYSALPSTIHYSVTAANPFASQGTVGFSWKVDGTDQGINTSAFDYSIPTNFDAVKSHKITAFVFNSEDTSTISWNIYTKPVVISTEPNTNGYINVPYLQKFRTFHLFGDQITYSLTSSTPGWLTISADSGILKGTPPAEADYTIGVIASGNNGDKDTLTYILHVSHLTSVRNENELPGEFKLSQNYPNPFNPTTIINYEIPKAGFVTLIVYDILGRVVANLINEEKPAGKYSLNFDGSKLSSGVYFYRLTSGGFTQIKKMMIMK